MNMSQDVTLNSITKNKSKQLANNSRVLGKAKQQQGKAHKHTHSKPMVAEEPALFTPDSLLSERTKSASSQFVRSLGNLIRRPLDKTTVAQAMKEVSSSFSFVDLLPQSNGTSHLVEEQVSIKADNKSTQSTVSRKLFSTTDKQKKLRDHVPVKQTQTQGYRRRQFARKSTGGNTPPKCLPSVSHVFLRDKHGKVRILGKQCRLKLRRIPVHPKHSDKPKTTKRKSHIVSPDLPRKKPKLASPKASDISEVGESPNDSSMSCARTVPIECLLPSTCARVREYTLGERKLAPPPVSMPVALPSVLDSLTTPAVINNQKADVSMTIENITNDSDTSFNLSFDNKLYSAEDMPSADTSLSEVFDHSFMEKYSSSSSSNTVETSNAQCVVENTIVASDQHQILNSDPVEKPSNSEAKPLAIPDKLTIPFGESPVADVQPILSPVDIEYSLRLQETIAKLSGEDVTSPTSWVSEEREEELVVKIELSKLKSFPLPSTPALLTKTVGTFVSQAVQVDRGMIVDKEMLDSYLAVKFAEALYEMKEQLHQTEAQVKQVKADKERLERMLRDKIQMIKDLTVTGFKPVLVDVETMTDDVPALTLPARRRVRTKSVSSQTQISSTAINNQHPCFKSLSQRDLEPYLRMRSATPFMSPTPEPDEESEDETVQSKKHWMFTTSESCSRCNPIRPQIRLIRGLKHATLAPSRDRSLSAGKDFILRNEAVTSNVIEDKVAWTMLGSTLQKLFVDLHSIFLLLRNLPIEAVLKQSASKIIVSLGHLLSHLPIPDSFAQTLGDHESIPPTVATYHFGWKMKELISLLRQIIETADSILPKFFKAELIQCEKVAHSTFKFAVEDLRNETMMHGAHGFMVDSNHKEDKRLCLASFELPPLPMEPFFFYDCDDLDIDLYDSASSYSSLSSDSEDDSWSTYLKHIPPVHSRRKRKDIPVPTCARTQATAGPNRMAQQTSKGKGKQGMKSIEKTPTSIAQSNETNTGLSRSPSRSLSSTSDSRSQSIPVSDTADQLTTNTSENALALQAKPPMNPSWSDLAKSGQPTNISSLGNTLQPLNTASPTQLPLSGMRSVPVLVMKLTKDICGRILLKNTQQSGQVQTTNLSSSSFTDVAELLTSSGNTNKETSNHDHPPATSVPTSSPLALSPNAMKNVVEAMRVRNSVSTSTSTSATSSGTHIPQPHNKIFDSFPNFQTPISHSTTSIWELGSSDAHVTTPQVTIKRPGNARGRPIKSKPPSTPRTQSSLRSGKQPLPGSETVPPVSTTNSIVAGSEVNSLASVNTQSESSWLTSLPLWEQNDNSSNSSPGAQSSSRSHSKSAMMPKNSVPISHSESMTKKAPATLKTTTRTQAQSPSNDHNSRTVSQSSSNPGLQSTRGSHSKSAVMPNNPVPTTKKAPATSTRSQAQSPSKNQKPHTVSQPSSNSVLQSSSRSHSNSDSVTEKTLPSLTKNSNPAISTRSRAEPPSINRIPHSISESQPTLTSAPVTQTLPSLMSLPSSLTSSSQSVTQQTPTVSRSQLRPIPTPTLNDNASQQLKPTLPQPSVVLSGTHHAIMPILQVVSQKQALIVKWTLPERYLHVQSKVAQYKLYAFAHQGKKDSADIPPVDEWGMIGTIKPLALPMAVTLTNFSVGHKYSFAVRAQFQSGLHSGYSRQCSIML